MPFAGVEHVEKDALVQMVGHGGVNDVDVGPREERAVVGIEVAHCRHLAEPVEGRGIDVRHPGEFRAHGAVAQRKPAPKGTGGLASHQAGADDRNPNNPGGGRAHAK